jgi:ribosomal protein S18 acetylase RimI-like enzyme
MKTEFRKATLPREIRSLMTFDRKVFSASDLFPAEYWKACESWWMVIDGVKVGCCAFERRTDLRKGSLYLASTGILPSYRGRGLGQLLKSWQIAYAHTHGFTRILTHARERNEAIIALNTKFGFRTIRTAPRYYTDPEDAAVVMELRLKRAGKSRKTTDKTRKKAD